MNLTKIKILALLSLSLLSTAASFAGVDQTWKGITVDVKSDQAVVSSQSLTTQADGFKRLSISLSNKGKQALTIEKISIRIPLADPLTDNLEMIYGGSCMGRTPISRQNIGAQNKISSSHMYEIIRLQDGNYMFAGSLSWRIFMPNFTIKNGALEIWSNGEGKQLKPGETIQYEQIVLNKTESWLDVLDKFGSAIALENKVSKLKEVNFSGWATWDYYGRVFTANDIFGNMDQLNKLAPSANMIQIDGGWWVERGDYKSLRPDLLPGGLKAIVDKVRAEGKTAGVHFDGFRGDAASEICKAHPEYFLHDQDGNLIVEEDKMTERVMHYTFFDYSHPGARAHIADCIKNMKENWGIHYFKVDFMRYGLENDLKRSNKKVISFKAYDPTLTGVERFRLGMKAIGEAIGKDNYFLGCSAVFGPCIGFVDGMRTGGDINPNFIAFPERCQANLSNFYLCGKVFNGDADYLVFRAAADEDATVSQEKVKHAGTLTMNESQMWADFNKLFGTCRLSSDKLSTLRPERQALTKEVFDFPVMDKTIPLDFWQHGKNKQDGFELVIAKKDKAIYLGVFNWSEAPKAYALQAFGKSEPVQMEGRHSLILKYEGQKSFDQLCKELQVK
jgi:alpha-galactosidase